VETSVTASMVASIVRACVRRRHPCKLRMGTAGARRVSRSSLGGVVTSPACLAFPGEAAS
jgi:hypothetical protein